MLKITQRQKEEDIEISVNDDCGDGFKILIKKEDFENVEKGLENIFALAENFINANYISLHTKRSGRQNINPEQYGKFKI